MLSQFVKSSFAAFAVSTIVIPAGAALASQIQQGKKSFAIVSDTCVNNGVIFGGEILKWEGTPVLGEMGLTVDTNPDKSSLKTLNLRALIPGYQLDTGEYVHSALFEAAEVSKLQISGGGVINYKFTMKPSQKMAATTEGFTEKYELLSVTMIFEASSTLYVNFESRLSGGQVLNTLIGYEGCAEGVKNLSLLKALAKK